jgi:YfiH family protein
MVADCLPVLLADRGGRVVGAAHCGWRGLAGQQGGGALEALWQAIAPQVAATPEAAAQQTLAWLGPCIGPQAFEVGPEVREAFVAIDAQAAACFRPAAAAGKFLADLPGLARLRLRSLGITAIGGNDGSRAWCTVSNPARFFSHRRDRTSGRMAASVWLA